MWKQSQQHHTIGAESHLWLARSHVGTVKAMAWMDTIGAESHLWFARSHVGTGGEGVDGSHTQRILSKTTKNVTSKEDWRSSVQKFVFDTNGSYPDHPPECTCPKCRCNKSNKKKCGKKASSDAIWQRMSTIPSTHWHVTAVRGSEMAVKGISNTRTNTSKCQQYGEATWQETAKWRRWMDHEHWNGISSKH